MYIVADQQLLDNEAKAAEIKFLNHVITNARSTAARNAAESALKTATLVAETNRRIIALNKELEDSGYAPKKRPAPKRKAAESDSGNIADMFTSTPETKINKPVSSIKKSKPSEEKPKAKQSKPKPKESESKSNSKKGKNRSVVEDEASDSEGEKSASGSEESGSDDGMGAYFGEEEFS